MRILLTAIAISLAAPAPLCMALCGAAFAEQVSSSQAEDHELPCHAPAPDSEPAEAFEQCADTPSFVPARADNASASLDFADVPSLVVFFDATDRNSASQRSLVRPDILNSPYVRANPPLLN